ncbi:MAG: ABC transporter ATP-binding protein [Paracoccaceae bacterium]
MLEISGLRVNYGPIEAVHGIDLTVGQGGCVALLGPNGAGKSSTLAAVAGTAQYSGRITLDGQDLAEMIVEDRFRAGISLAPEGRRIFSNLSVLENLSMGAATRKDRDAVERETEEWLSRFPILGERRHQSAGTLSGGEQQMLTIARSLLGNPKILLLDEPSLGLAPKIIAQIFDLIEDLRRSGMTILLVEQNVGAAIKVSDHIYVLANGVITREGDGADFGDGSDLMNELTGVHG